MKRIPRLSDKLAREVARLIDAGFLDSRCRAADILLQYLKIGGDGPSTVPEWTKLYDEREANDDVEVNPVNLVRGGSEFAVLTRSCSITGAIENEIFEDQDAAKLYCSFRHGVELARWDAYLVQKDESSKLKLNGEGVRYVGWCCDLDDYTVLNIQLCRKVVNVKSI